MNADLLEKVIEIGRRTWEHKTGLNKVVSNSQTVRFEPFRLEFLAADKVKEQLYIAALVRRFLEPSSDIHVQTRHLFYSSLLLQNMTEIELIRELSEYINK